MDVAQMAAMANGPSAAPSASTIKTGEVQLCSSCDRCRSRKTKCDGARPCSNCKTRYMKKNKLDSIEGIDLGCLECVYSPAKRRGPVPGRSSQTRKAAEINKSNGSNNDMMQQQQQQQQQSLAGMNGGGGAAMLGGGMGMGMGGAGVGMMGMGMDGVGGNNLQQQGLGNFGAAAHAGGNGQLDAMALHRQMVLQQQQQQAQHQQQAQQQQPNMLGGMLDHQGSMGSSSDGGGAGAGGNQMMDAQIAAAKQQLNMLQQLQAAQQQQQQDQMHQNPPARRVKRDPVPSSSLAAAHQVPPSVAKHLPLLQNGNLEGNCLRSIYQLSADELFRLPPVPTDEEYCMRLPLAMTPDQLPRFDKSALQAARFAEIALGALADNQVSLALELSNATVMCLRECVEEPVDRACLFDVARAYLLHGVFRSFRGDMVRYFKYRRVCLTHLLQLDNYPGIEALLAAMSFHDSWAYMIHNASEEELPEIDSSIPKLPHHIPGQQGDDTVSKYGISTKPSSVASNPMNQMWIQGPPPVFLNNEAPPLNRSLDALACAIRSCCDQANARFNSMSQQMNADANGVEENGVANGGPAACPDGMCGISPTSAAVLANENELCSRNMVLSAFSLLQQHESSSTTTHKSHGHHLVISAMDAFLEGGDEDQAGGFTDSQIQSLLSVCNTVLEHPLLLHQGGPTYHMVSNAAILLCHLLNGLYANRNKGGQEEMEAALFTEVLDTFTAVRKLLNLHRRKLPVRLRCHGIPAPDLANLLTSKRDIDVGAPFIDLGETFMCGCRGCQGFVLMACSPCVAAERARAAKLKMEAEANAEGTEWQEEGDNLFDKELNELGEEFDLDDDALLNVLSRIIAT